MQTFDSNKVLAPTAVRASTFPDIVRALRDLTSTGTTPALNVSEGGVITQINVRVVTAPTINAQARLAVTIDGTTTTNVQLYNTAQVFDTDVLDFATVGDGDAAGDLIRFHCWIPYETSANVGIENQAIANGSLSLSVARSKFI